MIPTSSCVDSYVVSCSSCGDEDSVDTALIIRTVEHCISAATVGIMHRALLSVL